MRRKISGLLLLILGILTILYPFFNDWLSKNNQTRVIDDYKNMVEDMPKEDLEEAFKRAEQYNKNLINQVQVDAEGQQKIEVSYLEMLNAKNLIGEIKIPKINVQLPIYYGTDESVLSKGIGHVKQTSMPVGGTSTHAVLVGHRGLPEAELFTNLDKMETDDYFYLQVLDQTLIYQVDQIQVVEPHEVDKLEIIKGKDYVTLVTCTPYGINSQRLLIRGIRRESDGSVVEDKEDFVIEVEDTPSDGTTLNVQEETTSDKADYEFGYIIIAISIGVIFIILKKG